MRTFTRLFSLLAVLLPSILSANVIVHGRVKYTNGTGVAGLPVHISGDSALSNPSACYQNHITYTNSSGFYTDTLVCNTNMSTVLVWIINCNGNIIRQNYTLTANQNVESNFTYCDSTFVNQCRAFFSWQASNLEVHFNSSGSSTGNPASDNIAIRTWAFGDGTSLNGNVINPVHVYAQPGTYTVCLKIKTVSGCESTICNTLIVSNATTCAANFNWERIPGTNRVRFNSSTSTTTAPDSIISRKWRFGDGDSLSGNIVAPEHTYAQPGTYSVCLTIRTSRGCEKTTCKPVIIQNAATTCNANFNYWLINANTHFYAFEGGYSTVAPGDSILSRQWNFGDGTTGTGLFPLHAYMFPGTYTVCLMIQTASGCRDSTCKLVTVLPTPPPHCEAVFITDSIPAPAGSNPTLIYRRFNSTSSHGALATDSIISRKWTFGDGTSITQGNQISPVHGYAQAGSYITCLYIETASGCRDSVCKGVYILPYRHCEAVFTHENIATPAGGNAVLRYVRFNSTNSHGIPVSDSVISRTWNFGDGTGITQGNQVSPVHGYPQSGTYTACLSILTQSGCRDSICKTVIYSPVLVTCQPRFTTTATALNVVFNSSSSSVVAGDSIVERKWTFGDGTSAGNTVAVTHQYAQVGEYQTCLTIRTRMGCVVTWCKKIAVINQAGNCIPYFTKEQVAAPVRTLRFNSTSAYSQFPNDSIIERKWEFGDGQTLSGNVINPLHAYATGGTYMVCLKIRTARCEGRWCQNVLVRPTDSTNLSDSISIVNLYPVPATIQLNAVVFSSRGNVAAELAIYDVYGVKKWSQNKILPQGNSTHNIPTSQLANGPYIFRVTTMYGIKSRNFYKLN